MKMVLLAAAGGGIGAAGRYLFSVGATRWLGPEFPWGTRIDLNDETLEKLDLDPNLAVGSTVLVIAKAKVG